jgi:ribosome-binding protein aMBF1 (putative translation factor)
MSHQDWNTITIGNPSKQKVEKTIIPRRGDNAEIDHQKKIENDTENFAIVKIPNSLSKEIMEIRARLKLTQKEAANKLNIQLNVYTELENGKALYSNKTKQLVNKLEHIFGIKFKK